jgi:hypothetical protein
MKAITCASDKSDGNGELLEWLGGASSAMHSNSVNPGSRMMQVDRLSRKMCQYQESICLIRRDCVK